MTQEQNSEHRRTVETNRKEWLAEVLTKQYMQGMINLDQLNKGFTTLHQEFDLHEIARNAPPNNHH